MDNSYLCIFDIRNIQKFIFSSPIPGEISAASKTLLQVLQDGIAKSLKYMNEDISKSSYILDYTDVNDDIAFFKDDNILFQVAVISAGNALILIRNKNRVDMFTRCLTRYFLDFGSSLGVATSCVKVSGNYKNDITKMYRNLDIVKVSDSCIYTQPAIPIVKTEKWTSLPVILRNQNGDFVSRDSVNKFSFVNQNSKNNDSISRWGDFISRDKISYVHIDGNSLGKTIADIHGSFKTYEEGLKSYRKLTLSIDDVYLQALKKALISIATKFVKIQPEYFIDSEATDIEDYIKPNNTLYKVIHVGGDDINVSILPEYAFHFVEEFVDSIKKCYIWSDDNGKRIKTSVCAGVAFVNRRIAMADGLELAIECCDNAKKRAKLDNNLIDGQVGNWIDFEAVEDRHVQPLDITRANIMSFDGRYYLRKRPYSLDKKFVDSAYSFSKFCNTYNSLFRKEKSEKFETVIDLITIGSSLDNWQDEFSANIDSKASEKNYFEIDSYNNQAYSTWYDVIDLLAWWDDDVRLH